VIAMVGLTLVWSTDPRLHRTIWWELARVPVHGRDTRFVGSLAGNALNWLGSDRITAAAAVAVAAAAALVLGLRSLPHGAHGSRRGAVVVLASLCAVAVADASALAEYPYAHHVPQVPSLLYTTISASTAVALPGDEIDFTATVENPEPSTANNVLLEIELPPGLSLLGPPAFERGSGCTGTTLITCNLDFVVARQITTVRFGTRVLPDAGPEQKVSAWASSQGVVDRHVSVTVNTGSA
jgi:uncharacterized repeat protein (TIGR01451 family)